jgi:hypothetical protein
MKLLRDSYGSQLNIFETTIPFSIRVKECGKAGESIYRYDAKGKAAAAFEQLAGEVLAYRNDNRRFNYKNHTSDGIHGVLVFNGEHNFTSEWVR